MKYFVRIKRHGKLLKPFFGHFSSLSEADIIARHESREPGTNKVDVITDKGEVKRSYKLGDVGDEYKGNPVKKPHKMSTGMPHLVQMSDDGKTNWQTLMKFKSDDISNAKKFVKLAAKFNPKKYIRLIR